MTSQDDGRKVEREDDEDGQGRSTREGDGDGREGWTPDAEKPQRKGDVTRGEPGEADAGAASDAPEDAAVEEHEGDVPEGGTGGDDFEPPLETREYPVTTDELRREYGEYRVDTDAGSKPLKELLEPADGETFGSADEVRDRIEKLADR